MSSVAEQSVGDVPGANRRGWLVAFLALLLSAGVYFNTFVDLWPLWDNYNAKTYTHGPLIAAICLWLAWRERASLRGAEPQPTVRTLPAVLLLSFVWLVLDRATILTAEAALWPLLAWTIILAATGWRVARHFVFALGYFWFAVPVWDVINDSLQALTVRAVHILTVLTRVPAVITGNTVTLPQGQFEVASGCSGLHYFMVGLAIAALAGQVHRDRMKTRVLLLALAAALALVSNWLRVYIIVLSGYLTDMQSYLVRVDHYKFGWAVFAVAMLGFFLVLRRIPASGLEPPAAEPGPRHSPAAFVVPAVAACILPLASWASWQAAPAPRPAGYEAVPVAGFSGPLSPSPAWHPVYHGAAAESRAAYLDPAGRVLDYYGNFYSVQHQGEELVGYRNHLFDVRSFSEVGRTLLPRGAGGGGPIVELRLKSRRGEPWVVLYQYHVGSHVTGSARMTQLLTGLLSLPHPVPAGIRAVAAPCDSDCDATRHQLTVLFDGLTRTH